MSWVTVVPDDNLIIVNGEGLVFPYHAPENMHALQWTSNAGHIEWKGAQTNRWKPPTITTKSRRS